MADEKPLPATAGRLRKARRDGDLPHAPEALSLAALAGGLCALQSQFPQILIAAGVAFRRLLQSTVRGVRFHSNALAMLDDAYRASFAAITLAICVTILGAACAAVIIAKFLGTVGWNAPTFKLGRLAPEKNLKRIFAPETFTAVARAFAVAGIILVAIIGALVHAANQVVGLYSSRQFATLTADDGMQIVWTVLGVGAVFALLEARSGVARWHKKLRMSFEEIKREHREQNGDPHMRGRRKRRHRRMVRGGKAAIRRATVVVTNPTHLAIALEYNPPAIGVPLIVARAADANAVCVRRIAREAHVPIVEAVELARLLYSQAEEGDPIPLAAYGMVAPIIASVLQAREIR